MATKKFCDRCEGDITGEYSGDSGTLSYAPRESWRDSKQFDLCDSCDLEFLTKFMRLSERDPYAKKRTM